MKTDFARVTVAMITMNEEKAVAQVIEEIKKYAPGAEILIVDSSKDQTPVIAERMGARVIRQFPPIGYGPAMTKALRSSDREVVVTLDCDCTYPTEDIPKLVDLILEQKFDIVDGSRLAHKPDAMPWINYFANYFFALFASILFGQRITDLHSGMRAYRTDLVKSLRFQSKGAALPVELLLRPLKEGYKLKVVNIDYKERIGVSTMRPLESAWWTLKRILSSRFQAGFDAPSAS